MRVRENKEELCCKNMYILLSFGQINKKMKKCVDIKNVLNYNKGIVRNKRTVITRINP